MGIVILNYNSYMYTIDCVESILKQNFKDIHIVIVDNASSEPESKTLEKRYCMYSKITVIYNKNNFGFARGNNVGITYLRKKQKCEEIFIVNSDTYIKDPNFLFNISDIIKDTDAALVAPMCLNIDGTYQIPYGIFNGNFVSDFMKKILWICWCAFRRIFHIKLSITKNILKADPIELAKSHKYVIQGPAYFLTHHFFKHYDQIFPKTFLYLEEFWLALYLHKANLKTLFVPSAEIYHYEGGTTNKEYEYMSFKRLGYQCQSLFAGVPLFFMNEQQIKKRY